MGFNSGFKGLITHDHDDVKFMARTLKDEYEKWGLTMNLEKNQIYMYRRRKRKLKI